MLSIITRLNIGGAAPHVLMLTEALRKRGFDSELVSGTEGPDEGSLPPPENNYIRVPDLKRATDPIADFRTVRALVRLMRDRRPHIVHTHTTTAGGLGRLAAKIAGVPVVVHTYHGHVMSGYLSAPQVWALTTAERVLARWTDALVSVSAAARDELLALHIGRSPQWNVIPLGFDLAAFRRDLSHEKARELLGLPGDGPLIGIVGRLVSIKDHQTFIDAAALIARNHPSATFVVAGDGELRGALEARAQTALGERIKFLGWVTDLPALYAALDLVVLTSRNEGMPVALIEASAAGLPVVATRVGGVPEVVGDGITGLLVPPGNAGAVAEAVSSLLNDPGLACSMGAEARRRAGEQFSADRLVDDIVNLYTDLLTRYKTLARRS